MFNNIKILYKYILDLVENDTGGRLFNVQDKNKTKDAYKWFLHNLDSPTGEISKQTSKIFLPGKMYVFTYQAKHDKTLLFWDKNPIIISFGYVLYHNKYRLNYGINLSLIPPRYRNLIVDRVQKLYKSEYDRAIIKNRNKAIKQNSVHINYFKLKVMLSKIGFNYALKFYIPENINDLYVVSYENWDKVLNINQPKYYPNLKSKLTLPDIYKKYTNYVLYVNEKYTPQSLNASIIKEQKILKFLNNKLL